MERVDVPELLDSAAGTPSEISNSLRDIRRINTAYGGVRTSTLLLAHVASVAKLNALTVLDVAAGSGDVLEGAARNLQAQGIEVHPTLLDQSQEHLRYAHGEARVVGDAHKLPFADDAFDVVHCSLFLHHLMPDAAITFLAEARRVCRRCVLVNDLRRTRMHLALTLLARPSFSKITRHDAVASVRRAYTIREAESMARRADFTSVDVSPYYLYRFGLTAWK